MKYWAIKREDLFFTVVFYGLKNFGCKTTQVCVARRKSEIRRFEKRESNC